MATSLKQLLPWTLYKSLLSKESTLNDFCRRCDSLRQQAKAVESGKPRQENDDDHFIRRMVSMANRVADPCASINPGDSAVLVPLFERISTGQPYVIFNHRSYKLRNHRGEICFPGGRIDKGETPEQAALREANEEIGLLPTDVKVWGRLPAMITRQGTKVQPVVGILDEKVVRFLEPQTSEVQSIFVAPLAELSVCESYTAFRLANHLFKMPNFETELFEIVAEASDAVELQENCWKIWGLSAGILSELFAVIAPKGCPKAETKSPYFHEPLN